MGQRKKKERKKNTENTFSIKQKSFTNTFLPILFFHVKQRLNSLSLIFLFNFHSLNFIVSLSSRRLLLRPFYCENDVKISYKYKIKNPFKNKTKKQQESYELINLIDFIIINPQIT